MKRLFLSILLLTSYFLLSVSARVSVCDLRTERLASPLSLNTATPRFGWRIESDKNDVRQTQARLQVATSPDQLTAGRPDLWDTTISGDQSQYVRYAGQAVRSGGRMYWRVLVSTNKGRTQWSDIAMCAVGLLAESDWQGEWIGYDAADQPDEREDVHSQLAARYFRKQFDINQPVREATLYVSGLGLCEATINGRRVSTDVMTPAPTDYRRTALYNAYDVTPLITQAANTIDIVVGNGRFYTMQQHKKPYKITNFGYPRLRANLVITYADGRRQTIATSTKWQLSCAGPIRSNNEYDGEVYDARKEHPAYTTPQRVAAPYGTLRGTTAETMHVVDTIRPVAITKSKNGYIVDVGQNIAGCLRLRLSGTKAGDTITVRYAELVKGDTLWRDNLRNALSADTYIANGTERGRLWQPTFVTHGFRYAEVLGLPRLNADDATALFIADDVEPTGTFECPDTIINKVYANAVRGIRGNYKGLPVDCPQRDERMPWLGDRVRGCYGEAYAFNVGSLYAKWARDIVEAQREDGCIPDVAPAYWNYYSDNLTWPAALPCALDMILRQYGDDGPLRAYYPAVRRWLTHMRDQYKRDGLMPRDKYGDWCVPPEKPELIHSRDPKRQTDGTLIGTAYYYKMCSMAAAFAGRLGITADSTMFAAEAAETKAAFNSRYLTVRRGTSQVPGSLLYPDSTYYGNNTVTANVLPLAFGMVDDPYVRREVEKNVIRTIITDNKGHIPTGVIGTGWLMHTLTDIGRTDIAWLLAGNKTYPSWGYMAQHGATTTWELWNGDTASPKMNSGNHVMLLGDLLSWLYEDVAGIASSDGYKHITLRPDFTTDEVDSIAATYRSIYGPIVSKWNKAGGHLTWHITLPPNTTATAYMPDGTTRTLTSGQHVLEADKTWRRPLTADEQVQPTGARGSAPALRSEASKTQSARSAGHQQASPITLANEFLYTKASFPECHSVSVAEARDGTLVATFFGGTKERNPDVCIWVCRKARGAGQWTAPQQVADGVLNDTLRKACWNPVVYRRQSGEMVIDFKIGSNVADWKGWRVVSRDNGRTWTKREPLQDGYLGAVKNQPLLSKGRLIAPCSVEGGGWRLYFEYSDDDGHTWHKTDFVAAPEGVKAIQPAILTMPDGTLRALARTRSRQIAETVSHDNGLTWSPLVLTTLPNNNSGIDAKTLADGTHALVYNNFPIEPDKQKGARTPLALALSADGTQWNDVLTLEDSPVSQYSYPSIIQTADSHLHIVYTWRRQRIKHVEVQLGK